MWHVLRQLKTNVLILPLIRLAYKIQLSIVKRSARLQLLLRSKLRHQIRFKISESHLEGNDAEFDDVVYIAALRMSDPEIFDVESYGFLFGGISGELRDKYHSLKSEYETKKQKIDIILCKADSDERIKDSAAVEGMAVALGPGASMKLFHNRAGGLWPA